jgi:hypothetical protein
MAFCAVARSNIAKAFVSHKKPFVRTRFEKDIVASRAGKFVSTLNYGAYIFDDGPFKGVQHGANIVKNVLKLTGDTQGAARCESVVNGMGDARDSIGAVRFVVPLWKLLTLSMFFQTDGDGFRRVLYKKGQPVTIPHEDLGTKWNKEPLKPGMKIESRQWVNGSQRSSDGIYIDVNDDASPEAKKSCGLVFRDWDDIAMDVAILAARLIAPFRHLHNLKTFDLGKHADGLKTAAMALWAFILSVNVFQEMRKLINEVDLHMIRKRSWDVFQAWIDLIGLPFDFGLGSTHPALAITGSIINFVSASSLIAKEIAWYNR